MRLGLFIFFLFLAFGSLAQTNLCATCHGQQGISPKVDCPNLAGQHQSYLLKQINDIKTKKLPHAGKTNLLIQLSDKDMSDLATYYAKMTTTPRPQTIHEEPRGQQIYTRGDFEKRIPACISCHGPQGAGNNTAGFPVLARQHAQYLVNQLKAFQSGKRQNDLNHVMQTICNSMNNDDINAVARYIENF